MTRPSCICIGGQLESRSVPTYFFLNGKLHKYIKTVRSDNSTVAWSYQDEQRLWYPSPLVRKEYRNAYTLTQAAKLINIKKTRIVELIDAGLVKRPERSYDLSDYRPLVAFVNQDDMVEMRQAAWDVLPKNRFGEPYNDTMASEEELVHRMKLGDSREFVRDDDGESFVQVYKA